MNKKEVEQIVRMLIPAVKKIVKVEAKKVLKPLIKEAVEAQVNKMLAEQFVSQMGNRSTIVESAPVRGPSIKQQKRKTRDQLMRNLGLDESNPMMNVFDDIIEEGYSDIDMDPEEIIEEAVDIRSATMMGDPTKTEIAGEGVPLKMFGLSKNRPFVKF